VHKTVLVNGPSGEPIEVSEAKTHLNLSGSSLDTYLGTLITTARRAIENYLHRVLMTQDWKVFYDCWKHELLIPFGNLQTVTSVKYRDLNGVEQTLSADDYYWVVNTTDPGRIVRKYDATYPELQYGRPDAIEIEFTAGFGDAEDVPEEIKHAIKLLVTDYFEHKGSVVVGSTVNIIPGHVKNLIHSYKLYEF